MAGLSRLVRRICLLRELGNTAGARHLQENGLAHAVAEFRRAHGADALPDADLDALFAMETRRVMEASLTAEILASRLAELWSPLPVAMRSRVTPAATPDPAVPRSASAEPPAISDLLDAMLAAERPSTRPTPPR